MRCYAHFLGIEYRLLGLNHVQEFDCDQVTGTVETLTQTHFAVKFAVEIMRPPFLGAGYGVNHRGVPHLHAGRITIIDCGCIHKWLEGRTRLQKGLHCSVKFRIAEVLSSHHRQNIPGGIFQHNSCGLNLSVSVSGRIAFLIIILNSIFLEMLMVRSIGRINPGLYQVGLLFDSILCDLLGRDIERGELPDDFDLVGSMVTDICFRNAMEYLGLECDAGEEVVIDDLR